MMPDPTRTGTPDRRGGADTPRPAARPILKWAGGKRQLLPAFRAFFPPGFRRFYEPFAGSAAVFFDLHRAGHLTGRPVRLADRNADLMGCYRAIRDAPEAVIAALERLERAHLLEGATRYYAERERFNVGRGALRRAGREGDYTPVLAARFIYLNRTGYNGLFRLNSRGDFNVPAGRYVHPRICDAAAVRATAMAFGPLVELVTGAFDEAIRDAGGGDFAYFDPPYVPLSATASFGAYTATRFSDADQRRLCDAVVSLARAGCHVMLSNSSAPGVVSLYRRAATAGGSGLALWRLPARRAINTRADRRGPVAELLLTTLDPRWRVAGLARVGGGGVR